MKRVARRDSWFPCWVVVVALGIVGGASLLTAMRVSQSGNPTLLWLFPMPAGVVVMGSILIRGVRETTYAILAAMFLIGSIWQIHAGFRMTYLEGDTAIDTMIYNTTSPDVVTISRDLEELSLLVNGDRTLEIQIESCASIDWPFRWTMREMTNTTYFGTLPNDLAPIVIGSTPEFTQGVCETPWSIPGYTTQTFVLRWAEPENEIYRQFAIAPELPPFRSAWQDEDREHGPTAIVGSIADSIAFAFTDKGQRRLIGLLFYRQTGAPLNTVECVIHVRNDLMPSFNDVRYGT